MGSLLGADGVLVLLEGTHLHGVPSRMTKNCTLDGIPMKLHPPSIHKSSCELIMRDRRRMELAWGAQGASPVWICAAAGMCDECINSYNIIVFIILHNIIKSSHCRNLSIL